MLKIVHYYKNLTSCSTAALRHISVSATCLRIDPKWRETRGLPENPNSFGPLHSLPDYTYLDGRPTPMGSNQRKRLKRQREIAGKIIELSAELDFAKDRFKRLQAERETKRQEIISRKLKPKGHLLLKKD